MNNLTQELMGRLTPDQKAMVDEACRIDHPELIARLLKGKGLTPPEFARAHGFPASSVYSCIKGDRPQPAVRAALAEEIGLPEGVLFPPGFGGVGQERDAA